MNRITRLLAITGLGLGIAATVGAGPAQATTGTAQGAASSTAATSGAHYDWDDEEVVGYFRSLRACERVGRLGELRGRWDDYDCDRAGFGWGRGSWVLTVDDFNGRWDRRNWYGGWYNGYRGGDFRGGFLNFVNFHR
ncbi:hypothetical protein [Actinoplanes sp. URMC 104]|uniref:hypothetical protein n=1 Tax=Actinoplanes sp. URMC 104 TaxID=3423409 RepID=UPI003F1C10B2